MVEFTFEYIELQHGFPGEDGFVVRVRPGIRKKEELILELAEAAKFPGYFGHNWDALLDLLQDLSWIPMRRVLIVHDDVPLLQNSRDCRVYLEIIQSTLAIWSQPTKSTALETLPGWTYVEHELKVFFPIGSRANVERAIQAG